MFVKTTFCVLCNSIDAEERKRVALEKEMALEKEKENGNQSNSSKESENQSNNSITDLVNNQESVPTKPTPPPKCVANSSSSVKPVTAT